MLLKSKLCLQCAEWFWGVSLLTGTLECLGERVDVHKLGFLLPCYNCSHVLCELWIFFFFLET